MNKRAGVIAPERRTFGEWIEADHGNETKLDTPVCSKAQARFHAEFYSAARPGPRGAPLAAPQGAALPPLG